MPIRQKPPHITGKVIRIPVKRKTPPDPREKAFNKALGRRLKAWRDAADWSQKRMATALGIGEDAYKKYEYGTRGFPSYLFPVLRTITDRSVSDWIRDDRTLLE